MGINHQGVKLPVPNKTYLEELYLRQNKSPSRIAEIIGVGSTTVRRWLAKYDIPIKRAYTSSVKTCLTSVESAYFAGYLDGDGTINIGVSKNQSARCGVSAHYDVSLISKNKNFIITLQKLVGGTVVTFVYHDSRAKKNGYRLMFSNQRSALAFLEQIEPFLILKRQQANLMICFLKMRISARVKNGNSAIISDNCWEIVKEIGRLNK